jgi:hypothetical protein
LRFRKAQVGKMPASPPTLRGRCGALFVGAMRRSLFWLIQQLDDFDSQIVEAYDRQLVVLKDLASAHDRLAQQVAKLNRGLSAEMAAREEAERSLRTEISERQSLAESLTSASFDRNVMEVKFKALETAVRNLQDRDSRSVGALRTGYSSAKSPRTGRQERPLEIGICGTFDVLNYGDLLFPTLAEFELKQRLGGVRLQRFSYNAKARPSWAYDVISVSDLPDIIQNLDGLLIGGGLLVRFDKDVAPGYEAPAWYVHHPTGYWLTPALLALQHDVPLAWNAPGMHNTNIPGWSLPLLDTVLDLSQYVAVRDELSRAALQPHTLQNVVVSPDTAFGLPNLLNYQGPPSREFRSFAAAHGLERPYVVFQPNRGFEKLVRLMEDHPGEFAHFQFLVLPISIEFGENPQQFEAPIPGLIRVTEWLDPLLTAEVIGRSEAAIGNSYHFNISALVAGVPVFRRENLSAGKFTGLQGFDTIFVLPPDGAMDLGWFLARIGRKAPSPAALAALKQVGHHWDRIADVFEREQKPTAPALNRFWQSLPRLLEERAAESTPSARPWKGILKIEAIRNHSLETQPYRWAAIDNLYDGADCRRLSDTYPCDHFKLVAGHDGEKEFEYEVRCLIEMGSSAASHSRELSDAWRQLAADLTSADYRAALSALTGYDLSGVPIEVNVFHYGPGCSLGAHKDLPDKLVTHVLYFNRDWNSRDGGCLRILGSQNEANLVKEVLPVIGNSAVLVRSDNSWHAVSPVVNDSATSRRSVTVTFYRPGSVSTMWPPGDTSALHVYRAAEVAETRSLSL